MGTFSILYILFKSLTHICLIYDGADEKIVKLKSANHTLHSFSIMTAIPILALSAQVIALISAVTNALRG
tara:strand:+ start:608 stop:817 length:210 start_codon:yes stop_codon:yes gene_type:complete